MKQTAFRFSVETQDKLIDLLVDKIAKTGKPTSQVDIIRDLINKAHKKL